MEILNYDEETKEFNLLGETLRRIRKERLMKISVLAVAIGVKPQTISNIEQGNKKPSKQLLFKVCSALKVNPIEELLKELKNTYEILVEEMTKEEKAKNSDILLKIENDILKHYENLDKELLDHLESAVNILADKYADYGFDFKKSDKEDITELLKEIAEQRLIQIKRKGVI